MLHYKNSSTAEFTRPNAARSREGTVSLKSPAWHERARALTELGTDTKHCVGGREG